MEAPAEYKAKIEPRYSLCWSCDNAYAHKCEWIAEQEHIWTKARKEKRHDNNARGYVCVYIVEECEHYVPDKPRQHLQEVKKKGRSIYGNAK